MSALWTGVSYALTLAGVGTFLGYKIDWLWFSLGGFIVFLGFVSWWLGGLHRRIHELEANKPSIEVKPLNKRDMYCLEVKNIGNTGTFEAEIQITKSNAPIPSPVNQYTACWTIARGREAQIKKGLTDRLKIAHFITSPPDYLSQHLDIYYYEPQSGQENHVHSDSYLVGAKVVSANGEERPLKKPEFVLQVTISSEPSLKEGSFIKKYKLGLSGLEELPN